MAKDSLRVIEPGDYTKKEVNRIFRNINSVEVISKVIYGEFEEEIKAKINKLRNRNFCNEPKYERLKIKQELEDFTVDIPLFIFQKIKSVDMRVTHFLPRGGASPRVGSAQRFFSGGHD